MMQVARIEDLREIKMLTVACAIAMEEKGIFQWNEHYPSLEKLEQDILKGDLYVLREEDKIVGIIVLTLEMDEEYVPIDWLTPNKDNLYVHRLAVHPSVWGKSYGQALMAFAEVYAKEQACISIRLDTFSQNKRNHRFYEALGFQRLGDIYFPLQSEHPFHCYEKVLL